MTSSDQKSQTRNGKANQETRLVRYRQIALLLTLLVAAAGVASTWWWMERNQVPVTLKVGAGPYRTDSYQMMKEVAEVIARHSSTVRLDIVATSDSSRNISDLNARKVDLATIRSDTPVVADVRTMAELFPDFFQILVRSDSGASRIGDLVGKRVAIPPFGTDEFRSFWIIADHYDLPVDGVRWITMPFSKAAEELLSGKVDALFTVRSLRDRVLLDLFEDSKLKNLPLQFIPIDQAKAISIKRPFLGWEEIPKGSFDGSGPVPQWDTISSVVKRVLVTRADVDEGVIREITRVMFENRLDLTVRFALASAIRKPDIAEGLSIPLHDGADGYYNRNQPIFIQENAEPIALMVTLAAMLGSGLLALRSRFNRSQKNRMDSYNYVLLDLAEQAQLSASPEDITLLRTRMFDLLETVVRALDTDEVTEEGFQSFSLLYDSVREMLRERMNELAAATNQETGRIR
ncbi:MAG: TAXI family TRAP transporter solute-binding subunit [Rhizobiaceae bacterium]